MTRPFERLLALLPSWRGSWRGRHRRPQDAKVVQGKNGKLFLHNDTNHVMRQITGAMRASGRDLAALRAAHAWRHDFCAQAGIAYRHVICPNKESVETADLPDGFVYEQHGPSYLTQYRDAGALDRSFYDRATLQGLPWAYFRSDSHWSEIGALAYLTAALRHFDDTRALQRLDALDTTPEAVLRQGDLGLKLGWPPEDARGLPLTAHPATLVFEGTPGEGYVRFHRASQPLEPGVRALVLHDSFTEFLFRPVCELYGETLFIHTPDLDPRFLARFSPDVLWFFQAERFLPRLPRNDVDYVAKLRRRATRRGLADGGAAFLDANWPDRYRSTSRR